MALDDLARQDMARIVERNQLAIALRNAQSQYGFAQIEASRAFPAEREAAFARVRELEAEVEEASKALEEYDQAARQRGWPGAH